MERHDAGNFWGGVWGYVTCFTVTGREVPWREELLREAKEMFNQWIEENHQRTHVAGCFYQLAEPFPWWREFTRHALQDQRKDGSWGDRHWDRALPQTAANLIYFRLAEKLGGIEVPVDRVNLARSYITVCQRRLRQGEGRQVGYAHAANVDEPDPTSTAMALAALINPEMYIRWLAPKRR